MAEGTDGLSGPRPVHEVLIDLLTAGNRREPTVGELGLCGGIAVGDDPELGPDAARWPGGPRH